jgi:hypothetical protein
MAAIRGPIRKYTLTSSVGDIIIFSHGTKIQDFVTGATAAPLADNATRTVTVKGSSRRRYPGGPTTSVKSHQRTSVVGPPAKYAVLPGQPFKIEVPKGTTPETYEVHQFSFEGPWTKLYEALQVTNKRAFIARSPWGKPLQISHSGTP